LPLVSIEQVGVRAQPVHISNYTRVFKGNDCIIDEEASSMRGVENVMVCVFGTGAIKVGGRERTGVEWHGVNWGTLLSRTFNTRLILHYLEGNVGSCFCLPLLIDKDEGVLTGVCGVELLPSLTRVLGVLCDDLWLVRREGIGFRPGGDAMEERDSGGNRGRLRLFHVVFKDVGDVGYEEEVEDVIVVLDVKVNRFIVKTLVS
jgi:hypothetical protein